MVIDLKRVHLGESIDDGALWVVEQIPGYVESADETDILRAGHCLIPLLLFIMLMF